MGGSLGELGVKKVARADSFGWFGEEMTIGNVSELVLLDFLDAARQVDEKDLVRSLEVIRDGFRVIVAPEDFPRFWEICIREKQGTHDLMTLMTQLIEGTTGVPTKRRSGSSHGRRDTKQKSKAGSSSGATRPKLAAVPRKVMDRFERHGRADLAIAVRTVQPVS
jgi:hypothetical protein